MENLNKATIPIQNPTTPTEEKKETKPPKSNLLLLVVFLALGIGTAKLSFHYLLPIINANLKNKKTAEKQITKTTTENKSTINFTKQPQTVTNQASKTINNLIQNTVKPKNANQPTPAPFNLNGIFFSEVETKGTALINNKIVQEGDTVDNAKVIKIEADTVELELNGQKIKLLNR